MSDSPVIPDSTSSAAPDEVNPAGSPADPSTEATVPTAESAAPVGDAMADTAGTGTIIALGCITGTVFIIILGVVYLLVTQLFG